MSRIYRFDGIEVDLNRQVVIRAGTEHRLRPQTSRVFASLLENRQRVVTKAELTNLWPIPGVTDQSLTQCIKEIRRALGDSGRKSRFIRTVPKRGYQFIGKIEVSDPVSQESREI